MTNATGTDPLPSRGFEPGGCLVLLFVVLLLAALPPLLKGLGVVLALLLLVVTAAVVHGTVQGKGGWRALFERVRRRIRGMLGKGDST